MSKNPLRLKVAYLYPDLLQGVCDKANLDVFRIRAAERNINVEIDEIKNDDKINTSKYDFFYISGSNIEALDICNKKLRKNYTQLHIALESEIPMLAINCGYILFGKTYQADNLPMREALGILNTNTVIVQEPIYTKIVGTCNYLRKYDKIVGFLHSYAQTSLEQNAEPFLYLKKEKTEGSIYNNAIGTGITSPILAQNPYFCDFLIANCLKIRYKCQIPLAKICDDIEWYSHNYLLEAK